MSDLNARFNAIIAQAPKRQQVVGEAADGTVLTVEVPAFNFGKDSE